MDRRQFLASFGVAGAMGLAGCGSNSDEPGRNRTVATTRTDTGESTASDEPTFRVGDDGLEKRAGESMEPFSVRGVNLGMAKPGRFPGEAAITRAEYDRWVSAIGDIANVVRTYTIHPPAFYRALAAYNERADSPLLLLQGTWVPTVDLIEAGDAGTRSTTVDREIRRTVDAIHGGTTLPERRGHASGTYDADVSEWVAGFLFGIEWPPEVVAETNAAGESGEYEGTYLRTDGARPFEQWLAGRLDGLVTHEMAAHGTQRPVAFVNWVTTDPLSHPYEPFRNEDRVSVDPDAIVATTAFEAGTLAAYHVYPYYPDLLNETPQYVDYVDHRGQPNSYAGYLDELVEATTHPVLVAEFGVPSSRGIAHRDVHGRDQGRHTEREQGEIVAAMYEDIRRAGAVGGITFAWQDEWFKRTWNLDARSVPGRRPHWSNIETPEQRFGLLAFEQSDAVTLSGASAEWNAARTVTPSAAGDGIPDTRTLTALRVAHDLEGLTLRVEFETLPEPVDWSAVTVLLTVSLTGRENPLPFGTNARVPADFVVRLGGPDESRLLVDSTYDAFAREFGEIADLPIERYRDGSAGFVPVREPISLGYTVPATDERVPFEAVETGRLRYGNGNPADEDYDSLTDVHVDSAGDAIELRIPWILLNVADPSSKRRIATEWSSGLETVPFDDVAVSAATYHPDSEGTASDTIGDVGLSHAVPGPVAATLSTASYTWETWNRPATDERLKESYEVLQREWANR